MQSGSALPSTQTSKMQFSRRRKLNIFLRGKTMSTKERAARRKMRMKKNKTGKASSEMTIENPKSSFNPE